jgi:hypothetical protein
MRTLVMLLLLVVPSLGQTPETKTPDDLPTVAELQRQVIKLQNENDALRREIKALRQRFFSEDSAPATQPEAVPAARSAANIIPPPASVTSQEAGYWLTTSTGKRHNKRCRYYEHSKGRACGPGDGTACKACGG